MTENGLITVRSVHDVPTTLARLTTALETKGVTIFARIEHAAGAADVGLPLRPTTVVLFGNPAAGTPLMQQAQTTGIDLPLKALVWEDAKGTVQLSYNDPAWIAARHHVGSQGRPTLSAMAAALQALVKQATAP